MTPSTPILHGRRRQLQQQPQRQHLNREQQQQGSTEFQQLGGVHRAGPAREMRSGMRDAILHIDA